jgi:hypothetical protein
MQRWNATASEDTRWIIRHGLRTLIKQGHPTALALIGLDQTAQITVSEVHMPPDVQIGQTVKFRLVLSNPTAATQTALVDYVIHHVKANGQRQPKVFKLRAFALEAETAVTVEKSHSFRPVTTRTYYPGVHRLEIQVNGIIAARVDFTLRAR